MSFRLQLTFSGLCLFVRDKAHGQFHVLLPAHNKHYAKARYAAIYEGSASPNEIDVPIRKNIDWGDIAKLDTFVLPPSIVNVGKRAGNTHDDNIDPVWIGAMPGGILVSRISLPGSAKVEPFNFATFGGVDLASCADVTVENVKDSFIPRMVIENYKLKPVSGRIQIMIGNMTAENWKRPPETPTGSTADHFKMYYQFLKSKKTGTVPKPDTTRAPGLKAPPGVDPLICMLGGGCLTDDPC